MAFSVHDFLVDAVSRKWEDHKPFLDRMRSSLSDGQRETVETVSGLIWRLCGGEADRLVEGYRWMCGMILAEELEFRRTGSYRSSTFEEVSRRVYFDTSVMGLYMDGLLLSQVLWGNHISILDSYVREYLPRCPAGMRHLEVGPGHGLLLFLASRIDGARLTGWDVSSASIERTRTALARLGASGVTLARRSVTDPPGPSDPAFDSVVISEVLEHLEHPDQALLGLRSQMSPGARIFVNAPVNSPTVDHIHLFRAPEEIVDLVVSCGFEVEATRFAPSTGYTEARARQLGSTISCAVIARKVT